MATCAVTGKILDSTETGLLSVQVCVRPLTGLSLDATTLIAPKESRVATNASGDFTLTLSQNQTYSCRILYPPNATDSAKELHYTLSVPVATTANFNTIVMVD